MTGFLHSFGIIVNPGDSCGRTCGGRKNVPPGVAAKMKLIPFTESQNNLNI
jgi:hypothetical protein